VTYPSYVAALLLIGVFALMLDGNFSFEAARTAEMPNGMAAALAASLMPLFGNHGLWVAMLVFMAAVPPLTRRAGIGNCCDKSEVMEPRVAAATLGVLSRHVDTWCPIAGARER
jgi:hypothetical protein